MSVTSSNPQSPLHLQVFLASPGDVADERALALQVLEQLQYDPLLRGKITLEMVAWDKPGAGTPMLATALASEIDTLAYPQAALFGFCVAVVTYNVLAIAKAALAQAHGAERIDRQFSDYYLAAELDAVTAGMEVALPTAQWQVFRTLPVAECVAFLLTLAQNVRLARFKQHPRGPKSLRPSAPTIPNILMSLPQNSSPLAKNRQHVKRADDKPIS